MRNVLHETLVYFIGAGAMQPPRPSEGKRGV